MPEKKSIRREVEKKAHPTVQHESSAESAQDLGIRESSEAKKENVHSSTHRGKHFGSDGGDQQSGSNH